MRQPSYLVAPAPFPRTRPRRLRREPWIRRLVAEHRLSPADLIQPFFVLDGEGRSEPVPSMPGVERLSVDLLVREAGRCRELGIPAIALFPVTPLERKSEDGAEAWNEDNLVCRAIRTLKRRVPTSASSATWRSTPTRSTARTGSAATGS